MLARCLAVALFALASLPSPARAHQDPPGCFQISVFLSIAMFRSDGVTPVVGAIEDCEQVFYRVQLSNPADPDDCAFEGGSLSLTTPDGTVHTISSSVPCLGGTTGTCTPGTNSILSGMISYTASPGDVSGGQVVATSSYGVGIAHDSAGNTPGVSAFTPRATAVVACAVTTTVTTTSSTTTTMPQSVCTSIKLVAATKLGLALAKCEAKAVKGGVAVVQLCRDKAIAKFTAKWTSAENKGDCITTGDQADIQALIDACTNNLTNDLVQP
jgi:hypothetical protein